MKRKVFLLLLCLLFVSCSAQDDYDDGDYYDGDNYYYVDTEKEHTVTKVDTNGFAGIYMPENEDSDWDYIDVHDDGTFHLYGKEYDVTGWIGYDEEFDAQYAYNDSDGSGSRFYVTDDERLYFAEYGYFYNTGMDNMWYEDDNVETTDENTDNSDNADNSDDGNEYYSWNAELYQRNVSELEGIWYYVGELSAETYIVIDGEGNWSYYQRAPGTEAAEMDYGYLTYSEDEASTYYAVSQLYEGVEFKVFDFDEDEIIWGENGAYYLME